MTKAWDLDDDATLRRYLLDQASPEEQAEIEEHFIGSQEGYERLRMVESELIDDYWGRRLPAQLRERFETHYLASPVRRERAAVARQVLDLAERVSTRAQAPAVTRNDVAPRPRPQRWTTRARAPLWTALAAACGLLVFSRLSPYLVGVPSGSPWPRPGDGAPPSGAPLSPPGTPRPAPTTDSGFPAAPLRLTAGRTRTAAGAGGSVAVASTSGSVAFQLDVARSTPSAYDVSLQTVEGHETWRARGVPSRRIHDGFAVFVEIPSSVLAAGDYVLALRAAGATGDGDPDAGEYPFRVVRH